MENGSSNSHDNSDKGGDEDKGKNQVNLLDQVLNADCRPVLEFALVSYSLHLSS